MHVPQSDTTRTFLKHEAFTESGKLFQDDDYKKYKQMIPLIKSLVKLNVLVRLNWYGKLLCRKILDGKYM